MKKVLSIILSAVLIFGVSACARAEAAEITATPAPAAGSSYDDGVLDSLTYISDYSVLLSTLKSNQDTNGAAGVRADAIASAATGENMEAAGAPAPVPSAAETPAAQTGGSDYSNTNVQVSGVDEGDIVKTDGRYLYVLSGYDLIIFSADGADTKELSRVTVGRDNSTDSDKDWSYEGKNPTELYVSDGKLAVVSSYYTARNYEDAQGVWCYDSGNSVTVDIYDISDPAEPALLHTFGQDGSEAATRMIDGKLYAVTNYYVYDYDENDPGTYVPCLYLDGVKKVIDASRIAIMPRPSGNSYATVGVYDIASGELLSSQTILGAGSTVYMNDKNLYIASSGSDTKASDPYKESVYTVTDYSCRTYTEICRLDVSEGTVKTGAVATLDGALNNQFSMDEYNGNLRVVTNLTGYDYKTFVDESMGFTNCMNGDDYPSTTALYVLDSDMRTVGSATGLAENETVYSVRFDGDWAYFCTYEAVDPLFAVDVSDPASPVVTSQFEITGFSQYLHVWSDGLLFGLGQETVQKTGGDSERTTTDGMKLVMFDTSDKGNVTAKSVLNLDADWSEALYNHKAILIDPEKNIIGFPAGDAYVIYGWTAEQGFFLKASIQTGSDWGNGMRGMYAGDYAYVVSGNTITVLDLADFQLSVKVGF